MKKLALATAITLTAILVPVAAAEGTTKLPPKITICVLEDGSGGKLPCVWDAKHSGNGGGKSYIIRKNDKTVYISHKRAHRLYLKAGGK